MHLLILESHMVSSDLNSVNNIEHASFENSPALWRPISIQNLQKNQDNVELHAYVSNREQPVSQMHCKGTFKEQVESSFTVRETRGVHGGKLKASRPKIFICWDLVMHDSPNHK